MVEAPNAARRSSITTLRASTLEACLDKSTINRIRKATKLTEEEIVERYEGFIQQFPDDALSMEDFKTLSLHVLEPSEVGDFTKKVFKMFDSDNNKYLTFEEFTLATEQPKGNPLYKLSWMFDNVYDEVRFCHSFIHTLIDCHLIHHRKAKVF